jgi:hypothetical protein
MKPVLQRKTKNSGTGASQPAWDGADVDRWAGCAAAELEGLRLIGLPV